MGGNVCRISFKTYPFPCNIAASCFFLRLYHRAEDPLGEGESCWRVATQIMTGAKLHQTTVIRIHCVSPGFLSA